MNRLASLLSLLLLAGAGAAQAETSASIPVEDFFRRDRFGDLRISPTGEYLAATIPQENRTSLVILRRSDMKMTGHVTLEEKAHVEDFYWVNPQRILYTAAKRQGRFAMPHGLPGLYGVNVDGSGQGDIHAGAIYLVDSLRNDDKYVLVGHPTTQIEWGISKLDVDTGNFKRMGITAPIENATFITDNADQVRFITGRRQSDTTERLYQYFHEDGRRWELVHNEKDQGLAASVRGFSADNKLAYLEIEEPTGPNGLYAFDMATGERKLVLRDDNVDPGSVLADPVTGGVYAVRFWDGLPRIEYIDKDNPYAQDLRKLQASFPDAEIYPTSFTRDGRLGIYAVASDTVPAQYYLYDRATASATFLTERAGWLKPEQLSPMQAIKYTARDGVKIEGFLTVPRGMEAKNLPLVVNPHGGPFGINDLWGYNNETQLLASRGYAVLQVNFRGSGNYGKQFRELGYRGWGGAMQDDLTDAVKALVAQGIADPKRVCIYGASYGGYAALMGVAKEPDLYRCAIGNVGVYDLADVYADDSSGSNASKRWFRQTMGEAEQRSLSPVLLAGSIKVPVLLGAGKKDFTAPPDHTTKMEKALRRAGVPVDMVLYEGEGHGNYLVANQVDWAKRVLAFLDKHLMPAKPAAGGTP